MFLQLLELLLILLPHLELLLILLPHLELLLVSIKEVNSMESNQLEHLVSSVLV